MRQQQRHRSILRCDTLSDTPTPLAEICGCLVGAVVGVTAEHPNWRYDTARETSRKTNGF